MAESELRIGGRQFRVVEQSTLEHDIHLGRAIRTAGLHKLRQLPEESQDEFAVRVHQHALDSDQVFALLGAILVPAEKADLDWTPQTGRESGEFFRRLHQPDDKLALHAALAKFSGFFAFGLLSAKRSRTASETQPAATAVPEEIASELAVQSDLAQKEVQASEPAPSA